MNLKHKPTLYPNHAQLLHVGASSPLTRREGAISRVDALGCWELHEEALEALERAIKIAREAPESRILLDVGDCLCLDGQDWRGEVLERLTRFSPQQPSGTIVMTLPFQNAIRPHIEDPKDLVPLLSTTPASHTVSEELSLFQPPNPTPTYARSNFVLEPAHLAGREEEIEHIDELFDDARTCVVVQGNVGTGKTALARGYAARVALHAPERELWWLSLEECSTTHDLARRFAQLFALRLGAQQEHWATRVCAMLAHRPLPPTLILDGVDALDEDAHQWLHHVMSTSPEARWLLTTRRSFATERSTSTPNIHALTLSPLDEADALALLMQRQLASPPVADLEQARRLWRACSGHPAALLHARRHASTLLEADKIEEAFSTSLRLERDWNMLDEETQDILLILGEMLASTSASMLERIADTKVSVALGKLERIGWLARDPSTPRARWSLPGLFKQFAEKQVAPARLQRAVERRADALLSHLSRALEALRTRDQPEALLTLTHHEVDMLDILDWGLEHRTEETLMLVAKMRSFYTISHNGHFYLPLLERAMTIAREQESIELLDELALSQAVFIDYNPELSNRADELYSKLEAKADRYPPHSRAELFYYYATHLEDMLTTPEELERCTDLLERAIEVLETEAEDLCRRAGAYSALARIELQRGNIESAMDKSLRGREFAIATGSNVFLGMTSFSLHRAYLSMGEREQAKRHGQLALEEMEKAGAAPGAIMALASIGYMHVYEGSAESSRQYLYRALQLSRANSYKFGEMNCHYLLGVANLIDQRWEHARDHLLEAEKFQIAFALDWNLNQNKIILAIALSGLGEVARARELLKEAAEFFAESSYPEITDMLAMAQLAPDVYAAGWIERDLDTLNHLEDKIRSHTFDNPNESGPGRSILLDFIESARTMLGQEASRDASPLEIAADGSSFKLPDHNDKVNLSRRRTVKRILAILAKARAENPGEVLDAHTLVERGWPGEVFEVRAGLMRLYVTINTLRKLGLEEVLQTHGEGYRLDPDVPIEVIGEPEE